MSEAYYKAAPTERELKRLTRQAGELSPHLLDRVEARLKKDEPVRFGDLFNVNKPTRWQRIVNWFKSL